MEVSYATMEAMGMLIQRLGQDARRLEKALAETMHTSAEWKRIADELKAERDAAKQEAMLARQRIYGLMIQAQDMRAEIERLKKPAHCTPCDPPQEASHITPEGKQTAEGAVMPKPGDVVRLVRVPTVKDCSEYDFQDSEQLRLISTQVNTMGTVVGRELCEACACVVDDTGTIKAWPLSCIEVVRGGDK